MKVINDRGKIEELREKLRHCTLFQGTDPSPVLPHEAWGRLGEGKLYYLAPGLYMISINRELRYELSEQVSPVPPAMSPWSSRLLPCRHSEWDVTGYVVAYSRVHGNVVSFKTYEYLVGDEMSQLDEKRKEALAHIGGRKATWVVTHRVYACGHRFHD